MEQYPSLPSMPSLSDPSGEVSQQPLSGLQAQPEVWKQAHGRKRPRNSTRGSKQSVKKPAPTEVANKFKPLEATEAEPQPQVQVPKRPPPYILRPPIVTSSVRTSLAARGILNFDLNTSRQETRIYPHTPEAHKTIGDILREIQAKKPEVQYHTFAPRGSKKGKKFVLTGFGMEHDLEDVKTALKVHFPGYIDVKRLTRPDKDGEQCPTPSLLVCTDHSVTLKALRDLRAVDYIRYQVREFHRTAGPTQCFRCMDYGHTAAYCSRHRKCGWCGGSHWTRECPQREQEREPQCQHCKGPHATTYTKCPKRLATIQALRQQRLRQPSAHRRPGQDYAAAARGHSTRGETSERIVDDSSPPSTMADLFKIVAQLMKTVDSLMTKVDRLLDGDRSK